MLPGVSVDCKTCGTTFEKSRSRYNEAIRHGWAFYCSKECLNRSKYKQRDLSCDNPVCQKKFKRQLNDIQPLGHNYCSRSCAVSINNKLFPKKKAFLKECIICSQEFTGKNKCCSRTCRKIHLKSLEMNSEDIVLFIQDFYTQHGRIPFKAEFSHDNSARVHFGT